MALVMDATLMIGQLTTHLTVDFTIAGADLALGPIARAGLVLLTAAVPPWRKIVAGSLRRLRAAVLGE